MHMEESGQREFTHRRGLGFPLTSSSVVRGIYFHGFDFWGDGCGAGRHDMVALRVSRYESKEMHPSVCQSKRREGMGVGVGRTFESVLVTDCPDWWKPGRFCAAAALCTRLNALMVDRSNSGVEPARCPSDGWLCSRDVGDASALAEPRGREPRVPNGRFVPPPRGL